MATLSRSRESHCERPLSSASRRKNGISQNILRRVCTAVWPNCNQRRPVNGEQNTTGDLQTDSTNSWHANGHVIASEIHDSIWQTYNTVGLKERPSPPKKIEIKKRGQSVITPFNMIVMLAELLETKNTYSVDVRVVCTKVEWLRSISGRNNCGFKSSLTVIMEPSLKKKMSVDEIRARMKDGVTFLGLSGARLTYWSLSGGL